MMKKTLQNILGRYRHGGKRGKYDTIVIGGGHNGLVAASYLQKFGRSTLVLEKRSIVGGAAVTEEIIPGFKFSRASYLAGLLRPVIIDELSLKNYGLEFLVRDPSSFTPTKSSAKEGKYLILGSDMVSNLNSISSFSHKDANNYPKYEEFLGKVRDMIQPLIDCHPPNFFSSKSSLFEQIHALRSIAQFLVNLFKNKDIIGEFYQLLTGPAEHCLNKWFESDILRTTLATDAVVGALTSPKNCGSGYVLLHHVMGEIAGRKGVWAYVKGGMGAISNAIASSAKSLGVDIQTNASVKRILIDGNRAIGVEMEDGTVIHAEHIVAACTPYHAMVNLVDDMYPKASMDQEFHQYMTKIKNVDYSCGSLKINCAVDALPNFTCYPSPPEGSPGPMHYGTIHFESRMEEIEAAYLDAAAGRVAKRPVIEMTIPSSLDATLAPPGKHVVQLFVQFAPYKIDESEGSWKDPIFKKKIADRCFEVVEEFCPGFKTSILGYEILSPLDLEAIFGLYQGSISHGSFGLHQLYWGRPVAGFDGHRTPIQNLYLASAGTHPGGGVVGASGRNCARVVLSDMNIDMGKPKTLV